MNPLAAIRTAAPLPVDALEPSRLCAHVEDLNWPRAWPQPDKKSERPIGIWAPGRNGRWQAGAATLQ